MNVWIVNPYGTLPSEGWREYRSAMLARALAVRGHDVTWWISDIEHRSKQRRPKGISDPLLPRNVRLEIVEARAYRHNISLGRIFYEQSFARGFEQRSQSLTIPDLIVLADPSLFFSDPVVRYAKRHKVPFVLDILDLWPELFHVLLPGKIRHLGLRAFAPLYRRRDRLVGEAAAVVAVTKDYLETVVPIGYGKPTKTVYLGVDRANFDTPQLALNANGVLEVIYAGTLGDAYDIPTLLAAIETLVDAETLVHFTIAGEGPRQDQLAAIADRYPRHVSFLGKVPAEVLADYYMKAHIGLAIYAADSTVSMPVKFYDYLAAGLATIGSMHGEAGALLAAGAGRPYEAGNAQDLVAAINHYIVDRCSLLETRRFAYEKSREYDQVVQHSQYAIMLEKLLSNAKGVS